MPDYKVKFETVFHVEAATEADAQEGAHQALLAGQCGLQPSFKVELQSEGNASSPSPVEPVLGADTAESGTADSGSVGVIQSPPQTPDAEQRNAAPAEPSGDAQMGAATEADAGGEESKLVKSDSVKEGDTTDTLSSSSK